MDRELKIGLLYGRNSNWIAGSYYIENLVFALKGLPDQPDIKIYTENIEDFEYINHLTNYPDMKMVLVRDNQNVFDKIINKITYTVFRRHLIIKGIDSDIDVLFPADDTYYFDKIKNKLYWIPDLQDKHYPEYFSKKELRRRDKIYRSFIKKGAPIVFSSETARNDFIQFYPDIRNVKTHVMPFAVTLPAFDALSIEDVKEEHGINGDYFICSNQFWAHKNHQIVLYAIAELKKDYPATCVVFTGKMSDSRNPWYINELMDIVENKAIKDNVKFLGFVDRSEQLLLMKHSLAIIQPSKFEGWSTVVEDAKALNQNIILSDIGVHVEQLPGYKQIFKKDNIDSLTSQMKGGLHKMLIPPNVDYTKNTDEFGIKFINIINEVCC